MIPADSTPAYAALTLTSVTGIALVVGSVLAMGVAVIKTGRSPLTLLVRAALHMQAAWLWVSLIAWPAVMRERGKYRNCFAEAHLRMVDPVRQAPEPVAEEKFRPPPSSGRPESLDWTLYRWLKGKT